MSSYEELPHGLCSAESDVNVTHGSCVPAGSIAEFCNEVTFRVEVFFSQEGTPIMYGKLLLSSAVVSFLTEDM